MPRMNWQDEFADLAECHTEGDDVDARHTGDRTDEIMDSGAALVEYSDGGKTG